MNFKFHTEWKLALLLVLIYCALLTIGEMYKP